MLSSPPAGKLTLLQPKSAHSPDMSPQVSWHQDASEGGFAASLNPQLVPRRVLPTPGTARLWGHIPGCEPPPLTSSLSWCDGGASVLLLLLPREAGMHLRDPKRVGDNGGGAQHLAPRVPLRSG